MELTSGFLIYAAAFRLAVIAAGVVAIWLGYLLFIRGALVKSQTEAGLEVAEFKLNLKNAAPGTCFAGFGAAMVIAMLVTGSPALTLETARDAAAKDSEVIRLKGTGPVQLSAPADGGHAAAAQRLRQGDLAGAMAGYGALLEAPQLSAAEAALALEPMARIALQRGDLAQAETLARLALVFSDRAPAASDTLARALIAQKQPAEAVALARRAVAISPDEPRYLHTLALSLTGAGERDEALQVLEEAIRLDPVYAAERARLQGAGQ